ncbi:hypothetical protein JOB18_016685 [Solea senegalensis]|uniref:Uncharacterized protein n=1 Tax=Solea senegalensis TaxID=28829 RepID=A0AAV6SHZ3_SOLSE|nr:hypothetical protein JOB18_016685 [Solea senegalensis]
MRLCLADENVLKLKNLIDFLLKHPPEKLLLLLLLHNHVSEAYFAAAAAAAVAFDCQHH